MIILLSKIKALKMFSNLRNKISFMQGTGKKSVVVDQKELGLSKLPVEHALMSLNELVHGK